MSTIFYLNNNGSGFADNVEIRDGETVAAFLERKNVNPTQFLVRLNRQIVDGSTILNNGDRLTVTPLKIDGAMN